MPNHQQKFLELIPGQRVYVQSWHPDADPIAAVLLIHGLCEHSGRYQDLADALTRSGIAAFSMDLIGHGKSPGRRVHISSFDVYTKQIKGLHRLIKKQHPSLPRFLFGHSMGAQLALELLFHKQDDFQGAVLSGSNVQIPPYISSFTILLGKVISALAPTFPLLKVDDTGISSQKFEVENYRQDPLISNQKFTARMGGEINQSIVNIQENASRISLPLLLLHGGSDPIVAPDSSRYLYQQVSSADKTLRIYPEAFHEVLRDHSRTQVKSDIINWLRNRVEQGSLTSSGILR